MPYTGVTTRVKGNSSAAFQAVDTDHLKSLPINRLEIMRQANEVCYVAYRAPEGYLVFNGNPPNDLTGNGIWYHAKDGLECYFSPVQEMSIDTIGEVVVFSYCDPCVASKYSNAQILNIESGSVIKRVY